MTESAAPGRRHSKNFYTRSDRLVPLNHGCRFLAVTCTGEPYLDETLVLRRVIDAETGEERPLGEVSLVRAPGPEERFDLMKAAMPSALRELADHSLFNPALSGERRTLNLYPTEVAGSAHGNRCALLLGRPRSWGHCLRIIDGETRKTVAEKNLEPTHPFLDRGVVDFALDGEGTQVAFLRWLMERPEAGPRHKMIASFHPQLDAAAAFSVDTHFPFEDQTSFQHFHLGWCEERWLLTRPSGAGWSLLILDKEGRQAGESHLNGPVTSLAAATSSPFAALGIASGDVELINVETLSRQVYRPFRKETAEELWIDVAIASDASWLAARHFNGELVSIVPGRESVVPLPPLESVFDRYDDDNDLCTTPSFGLGPLENGFGRLITVCGDAPTLLEVTIGP